MSRLSHRFAAVLVVGLLASHGFADATTQPARQSPLGVGDTAPPLATGAWLKGPPVARFEAGKIYVVEFWATWCGPCKATIPHLTELAKKYPVVTFIGQDCLEDDESLAKPFVTEMGEQMEYRVALDDKSQNPDGAMLTTWLRAAGETGIPTAFLVGKDGLIAWIGHPMELEPVLEKVVAGTYDAKAIAAEKKQWATLQQQIVTAAQAGDVAVLQRTSKEMKALRPAAADRVSLFEFGMLLRLGRADEARTQAESLGKASQDPVVLNSLAWTLATQPTPTPADLRMGHQIADRAVAMTAGHPQVLDTQARLYAVEKDWAKAVDIGRAAVAKSGEPAEKAALQASLDAYEKHELPAVE